MKNEIVEILKGKESEMDKVIADAKAKAIKLVADGEAKYKSTKDSMLSKLDGEAKKLQSAEEEKLNSSFETLKAENDKKIARVNDLFKKNKKKAVEHVINRLLEEILDQEDDKTSDRRAKNPA